LPSALEQIAELKLYHIPKALARGIDIVMLDLDVGFTENPMNLFGRYLQKQEGTPQQWDNKHRGKRREEASVDVLAQQDISFIMNRTRVGWRTWFTAPMPNIGIMFCRGNAKTVRMFQYAWRDYQTSKKTIRNQPGKDQNKVIAALRRARSYGLKFKLLPAEEAVLLDKIYKFQHITTFELGGEAAVQVLQDKGVKAVHTTCYEQKCKVTGLQAANAFWNPKYYDPNRRTITKPLVYLTGQQMRWEVRSLLYLAIVTNRSVIIPNLLGNELDAESNVELFGGRAMWPGFRVAFFKKSFNLPVQILEPAFYWRMNRDYADADHGVISPASESSFSSSSATMTSKPATVAPPVTIVPLQDIPLQPYQHPTIHSIEKLLLSDKYHHIPRLVLQGVPGGGTGGGGGGGSGGSSSGQRHLQQQHGSLNSALNLRKWAEDSVGLFESYEVESNRYSELPGLPRESDPARSGRLDDLSQPHVAKVIIENVRLCERILNPNLGNRSCFDKCD